MMSSTRILMGVVDPGERRHDRFDAVEDGVINGLADRDDQMPGFRHQILDELDHRVERRLQPSQQVAEINEDAAYP